MTRCPGRTSVVTITGWAHDTQHQTQEARTTPAARAAREAGRKAGQACGVAGSTRMALYHGYRRLDFLRQNRGNDSQALPLGGGAIGAKRNQGPMHVLVTGGAGFIGSNFLNLSVRASRTGASSTWTTWATPPTWPTWPTRPGAPTTRSRAPTSPTRTPSTGYSRSTRPTSWCTLPPRAT